MGALNLKVATPTKLARNVYCSFLLGNLEIALPVEMIQEVVNFPETVTKIPLSPDFIEGIFNLRGQLIPIANMHMLLKSDGNILESSKIVIVNYHQIKIGLLFDSTNEILKVVDHEICTFDYAEKSAAVVCGALKLNDGKRIIQIIDAEALIQLDQIPHVVDKIKITDQNVLKSSLAKNQKRDQCISFVSQDVRLAFKMESIYEILKYQPMQPGFVNYDFSLGLINLRGSMVPVINLSHFLGGVKTELVDFEDKKIIIIKSASNHKLGLLVDTVDNIISYQKSELLPISQIGTKRKDLFTSVIHSDQQEILMLDDQVLMADVEIHNIVEGHAKLFKEDDSKQGLKKKIIKEVFISFKIESLFLLPILDIQEIVNFPASFINPPGVQSHILGLMNLREKVVSVVDMRDFYGMPKIESYEQRKILIVHFENEHFGLVVDGVDAIVSINQDDKGAISNLMANSVEKKLSLDIKEIALICGKDEESGRKVIVLDLNKMIARIRA